MFNKVLFDITGTRKIVFIKGQFGTFWDMKIVTYVYSISCFLLKNQWLQSYRIPSNLVRPLIRADGPFLEN